MKQKYSTLESIHTAHITTQAFEHTFQDHLKIGLLLALKENGWLNEMQYRHIQKRSSLPDTLE